MRAAGVTGAVVVAAMVAALVFGFSAGGFFADGGDLVALAWGKVTLIDLYAGLVLFGGWVLLREGSLGAALPWWLGLAIAGNLAAGVYVLKAVREAQGRRTTFLLGSGEPGPAAPG